ncbi:MAG TPA: hypothetical protein VGH32_11080 [Pirellulales bacterium]
MPCWPTISAGRDTTQRGRKGRGRGKAALEELYAELRQHYPAIELDIRTVRPATLDEIEFCRSNEEALARESMRGTR